MVTVTAEVATAVLQAHTIPVGVVPPVTKDPDHAPIHHVSQIVTSTAIRITIQAVHDMNQDGCKKFNVIGSESLNELSNGFDLVN